LGRNDTYGYALAAQPDQSQGRQPLTRARSPPSKNGLPIRVPRRPLFRTVTPYAQHRAAGPAEHHAGLRLTSYRVRKRSRA
jgi:hypothetical protein